MPPAFTKAPGRAPLASKKALQFPRSPGVCFTQISTVLCHLWSSRCVQSCSQSPQGSINRWRFLPAQQGPRPLLSASLFYIFGNAGFFKLKINFTAFFFFWEREASLFLIEKLENTDKKKSPPMWLYQIVPHQQYVRIQLRAFVSMCCFVTFILATVITSAFHVFIGTLDILFNPHWRTCFNWFY